MILPEYEERAKERQREAGRNSGIGMQEDSLSPFGDKLSDHRLPAAIVEAAKEVGMSPRQAQRAKRVVRHATAFRECPGKKCPCAARRPLVCHAGDATEKRIPACP